MLIDDFSAIADGWIAALDQYNLTEICTKPSPSQWSIGQLYQHLVDDTNYYIEQIEYCFSDNRNIDKAMTPAARKLFDDNDFPDKQITGHANNAAIPQPNSIDQLRRSLIKIKSTMREVAMQITIPAVGKARHPGFGYLNAEEWLQLACMHFRHHLRQKRRIDDFLKHTKPGE